MALPPISVIIPTYGRDRVLLETLESLLELEHSPCEILVIDQSPEHAHRTEVRLAELDRVGQIRWIRLPAPSIPRAMNEGLRLARHDVVLFLDDDIVPAPDVVRVHASVHAAGDCRVVAGQVLQPGEEPGRGGDTEERFRFCSGSRRWITEVMAGNFSIRRDLALRLGGFDENFVQVAYCFEAEFSSRLLAAGERILFEPAASIRHLKAERGGTRSYGHHLTTTRPGHSVGAYYHLLRSHGVRHRILKLLGRPLRSVRTRHHLRRPWWIVPTLGAELWGLVWALRLYARGPRLLASSLPEKLDG